MKEKNPRLIQDALYILKCHHYLANNIGLKDKIWQKKKHSG